MPTVTADGASVHYTATGHGPGLVLVAGTGLDAQTNYGHLAPLFADKRTVVLPDDAASSAQVFEFQATSPWSATTTARSPACPSSTSPPSVRTPCGWPSSPCRPPPNDSTTDVRQPATSSWTPPLSSAAAPAHPARRDRPRAPAQSPTHCLRRTFPPAMPKHASPIPRSWPPLGRIRRCQPEPPSPTGQLLASARACRCRHRGGIGRAAELTPFGPAETICGQR
jgi:hypothetical protein